MNSAPNKMVGNEDVREFHFAGTGVHAPITVKAKSYEEALELRDAQIGAPSATIIDSSYEKEEVEPEQD